MIQNSIFRFMKIKKISLSNKLNKFLLLLYVNNFLDFNLLNNLFNLIAQTF